MNINVQIKSQNCGGERKRRSKEKKKEGKGQKRGRGKDGWKKGEEDKEDNLIKELLKN